MLPNYTPVTEFCKTNSIFSVWNMSSNTEAKRCFATHDEDIYYFIMRIYYFNRMRIYSTVQLCSITSLWHSGQHLCRAIGRLQVRISLGFWLLSKRRSLWSWLLWKKNLLSWTAMHIDFVMCKNTAETLIFRPPLYGTWAENEEWWVCDRNGYTFRSFLQIVSTKGPKGKKYNIVRYFGYLQVNQTMYIPGFRPLRICADLKDFCRTLQKCTDSKKKWPDEKQNKSLTEMSNE